MKAVFMTHKGRQGIEDAYAQALQERLRSELGLAPPAYEMEDLLKNEEAYGKVEYIFSTWGMFELSKAEIQRFFPRLKAVFYAAGTVQYFARPFLSLGIRVFSAWVANGVPVAEFAFSQIVLSGKGYFQAIRAFKEKGFRLSADVADKTPGNYGIQIGLLGAGVIGKMLIERLKTIQCEIFAFDPFLPAEKAAELGVQKAELGWIFANCDIVSNHIANNEQTKGMITYKHFKAMKKNATFINTGRGAQIVEQDLIRIMRERPDLTALLDVTDPNEPLPQGHPFLSIDNIVLSPHIAGSKGREVLRMGEFMVGEYAAMISGGTPKYEVTLEMLETMA